MRAIDWPAAAVVPTESRIARPAVAFFPMGLGVAANAQGAQIYRIKRRAAILDGPNVVYTGLSNAGYPNAANNATIPVPSQHEEPERSPLVSQIKRIRRTFGVWHFAHFWIVCKTTRPRRLTSRTDKLNRSTPPPPSFGGADPTETTAESACFLNSASRFLLP